MNGLAEELGHEPTDLAMVEFGDAIATLESMRDVLHHVAKAFDEDPLDRRGRARFLAVVARHVVHDLSQTILASVVSAGGVCALSLNRDQARRAAGLYAYLCQYYGLGGAAEMARVLSGAHS